LREDKEELIAQFIYAKVLRLEPGHGASHAGEHSAPSSGYAVCAYFRRFLIDHLRSASHQRDVSMEVDGVEEQMDEHAHAVDDPIRSVLIQHGLDEARVRHLAREFIGGLDRYEQLVLAGTFGWCSGDKGGLFGLASRHHIPSYHYRALKLGVTLKKSAQSEDFAATKFPSVDPGPRHLAMIHQIVDVYDQFVAPVNPVSGDFSVGAEGLMIRNGVLAEPVREVTVASTLQRMLQSVVEIGGDLRWLPGVAAAWAAKGLLATSPMSSTQAKASTRMVPWMNKVG